MNRRKIEKMVASYNRYAIKHGYSHATIEVDYEKKEVKGIFIPRDEDTYSGFFGFFRNLMIAGHNGSLQADYDRIVRELENP